MSKNRNPQATRLRALRQMHQQLICELYADVPAADLAALLACSVNAIYKQAISLGLSKNQLALESARSDGSGRYSRGIIRHLPGGVLQHLIRG